MVKKGLSLDIMDSRLRQGDLHLSRSTTYHPFNRRYKTTAHGDQIAQRYLASS